MATIDNAYVDLWLVVNQFVPLNPEAAIYKEWRRRYLEWGSPTGAEQPLDGGGVYQVFSHAIVRWTGAGGVEVVVDP